MYSKKYFNARMHTLCIYFTHKAFKSHKVCLMMTIKCYIADLQPLYMHIYLGIAIALFLGFRHEKHPVAFPKHASDCCPIVLEYETLTNNNWLKQQNSNKTSAF